MVSWLLDTNVLSEAVRPKPSSHVMAALDSYATESAIAAPVMHELRFGWLRMAEGQKRVAVGEYLQQVVAQLPVLPYDEKAARIHAEIRVACEKKGKPSPFADGQIAAIAMAHGLTLVTQNTKDFAHIAGLRLVNWWSTQPGKV